MGHSRDNRQGDHHGRRFNHYGNPVGAKFQKYLTSAGKVMLDSPLPAATEFLCVIRANAWVIGGGS